MGAAFGMPTSGRISNISGRRARFAQPRTSVCNKRSNTGRDSPTYVADRKRDRKEPRVAADAKLGNCHKARGKEAGGWGGAEAGAKKNEIYGRSRAEFPRYLSRSSASCPLPDAVPGSWPVGRQRRSEEHREAENTEHCREALSCKTLYDTG
ncbi:hypothetical protein KM043_000346 [Ampulex compressa]|nr:hypothetical protein KM043_000346 [Ampulex compressa]